MLQDALDDIIARIAPGQLPCMLHHLRGVQHSLTLLQFAHYEIQARMNTAQQCIAPAINVLHAWKQLQLPRASSLDAAFVLKVFAALNRYLLLHRD